MTMITSNLHANSFFDHTSFSSRPFPARSTSNKLSGPNDLSAPATSFGHNIWQSDWQAGSDKNSDHVLRDKASSSRPQDTRLNSLGASKRPQPPSLALPNIKASTQLFGNGVDRRSPIGSERGTARESEPHSARSRSQFESTSLTPTSFSNDSEISSQQNTSCQDQRLRRDPFGNAPSRERTSTWLDAPEFQPSWSLQQQDWVRQQAREVGKTGMSVSNKIQLFNDSDYEFVDTWKPYEKDDFSFDRNEFRPVLSNSMNIGRNDGRDYNFLPTNKNIHELNTSFARLGMDRETRQPGFARGDLQNSISGKGRFLSFDVQDRQYALPQGSGGWNGRTHAQNQSLQVADVQSPRPDIDNLQLHIANGPNTVVSQQNSIQQKSLQPKYQNSVPRSSGALQRYPNTELRPTDTQIYASQMYDTGFYNTDASSTGFTDYKGLNYNFDPTLGNTYELYNPITRTQTEANQVIRSPLLEEFRIHGRTKKYELKDIFGHIVEFSGDQLGSRFIQHKLEVANSEEKDRVFHEIASDCRQLMTDLFGNYVIQKLFEHGNQSQKKVLASHMKGHMMALSTQTYGCRVVQKALDHVLTEQQASLIRELDGYVLKVVDDQNGNHVIQKAIECIPGEHIQFIVDAHRGHVHALSKHAYGCRVIQRMLEHCQPRAKRVILDELHTNIGDLIQDPFGNYVVQHVIVNGEAKDRRPVIDKVQSRLLENAMHKFASNVVEKALDYAEEDQSRMLLQTLTSRDEQGQSQVIKLLNHQYGNYVIQKSAAYLNGQALQNLVEEMEQYLTQLRRVSTGKQTTALEGSIRDARLRLTTQRHLMMCNAPTEPSRYPTVGRRAL